MAQNLYPKRVEFDDALTTRLQSLYKKAYEQILSEISGATTFGVAQRQAILSQITQILAELSDEGSQLIGEHLSDAYKTGANQLVSQLKSQDVELTNMQNFSVIHKEAIAALVSDAQSSFAEGVQGVYRQTQQLLGAAVRRQIQEQLAIGKLSGKRMQDIKSTIVGALEQDGLDALKDKGGKTWSLNTYAEMLVRTKTTEARNMGVANRMAENGYDLVQVSAHGASDVCAEWEGQVLSLNGLTQGYPTVDEAAAGGLFHPNCLHAINALVPDLADDTDAYSGYLSS